MTKRQRAQVVELLRCAADERADGIGLNGMFDSKNDCGASESLFQLGWGAIDSVVPPRPVTVHQVTGAIDERYRFALLEAAARVEEGSWP